MALLQHQRLAIIGCGNLAESMVAGLLAQGKSPSSIMVTARRKERLEALHQRYQVHAEGNNLRAASAAEILILAVKPQQMEGICREIAAINLKHTLVISVAAGLIIEQFETWLNQPLTMVRSMPNTPASVQRAATGLFANARVNVEQRHLTESIFSGIGTFVWVNDEAHMDVVTAIAGSGPAYFFRIMEAMVDSAVAQGLPSATAIELVTQTCLGAGTLGVVERTLSLAQLRQKVTSKGGTTEAALNSMEKDHISAAIDRAICAAVERGKQLAAG